MRVLGISAFYHDSAAALVEDGQLVAAAQEERFTRKKHDPGFPRTRSSTASARPASGSADVDHVAFYDKPFLKFERLLETYLAFAPRGFKSFRMAMPLWLKEKLFQKTLLRDELKTLAAGLRLAEAAAVRRASPEPRGLGVLPFAVRGGRRPDDGRRRRMGDDVAGLRARATSSRC